MKPLKTLLCISFMLFGALMGSQAVARDANGAYRTVGMRSCAEFLQDLQADSWQRIVNRGWLGGYITAYNYFTPNTYQILGNSGLLGAELWAKNFCEKNPLKDMADVGERLMVELYPARIIKAPN